jgi:hypothetical protein
MGPRIKSRKCPLYKRDCKHNKAPKAGAWACGVKDCPAEKPLKEGR